MLVLHDRPGLDRDHLGADRHVLFYVDGAVYYMVPDRWIVGAIHDVDLNFNGPFQRGIAFVFRCRFQFVRLALC